MAAGAPVFKPDVRVALGQQLMFGLIGLVLATLGHYFKTRESFLKSAGIGLATGVALSVFLVVRNRRKGVPVLILGEDNLSIEDNLSSTVVPWPEISKAVHFLHGENRWEFHVEGRSEPVRYPLYGFLQPQLDSIKAALVKRLPCEEERTPMEGPRPLSLPQPERLAA